MRRVLRGVLILLIVLMAGVVTAGVWARGRLRASLPQLDGERRVPGLEGTVEIARDGLGIPTMRAGNRRDLARAMGFLHAQDRFFQMDLSRRRAAGELAGLVGARAIALDREIRVHRFRPEARRGVELLHADDRALLDAYTAGVNEGLASLGEKPFEYFLLRQDPQPWRAEDSLLVVLSMFITLQDTDGSYEAALATMRDVLPPEMFALMAPRGTEWDSPVVGDGFITPPVPPSTVYNARARRQGKPPIDLERRQEVARADWISELESHTDDDGAIGSNNWAIAGRLTADGGALIANDMHLGIRVPNTWYRAAWEWSSAQSGPGHRMYGVTLPGVPAMVVGSNTHVAWGFTNTYADWSDIVLLETDPARPGFYRAPDGWREIETFHETFEIAGQPAQSGSVQWTMWGPVLGRDHRGRLRAYRWVAHSAEQLATTLTPLEDARTIEDAFDAANGLGTPGQNLVVADRSGRIGWSIYGSIPRRQGFDGSLPASWADGTRRWNGWLADNEYPRVLDGRNGRIWTANARVVSGEMLATLGDGSYEVGSRARIIRDRLMAKDRFTPQDLLAIQLETRAEFLDRWRTLILETLDAAATAAQPQRARFREVVERGWSGRASPESAGYLLTRRFRERVSERIFTFVLAECYEADEHFDYTTVRRREGPIWRIVTEQPPHLLDPRYPRWRDMLLDAIDDVIDELSALGDLRERRWSEFNKVSFRHPLSAAVPLLDRWLDMPRAEIPGDLYTPRMMWGSVGASERMVVSPGREQHGIMHMPTGQSGHPLSPYYANSHESWVKGEATAFLPGATEHVLTLRPQPHALR
jgi:penicillin G amidase